MHHLNSISNARFAQCAGGIRRPADEAPGGRARAAPGFLACLFATICLFAGENGQARGNEPTQCEGTGDVRILLIAGTGASPVHLDELSESLAHLGEVCRHDRRRTNWAGSDSGFEASVEELRQVVSRFEPGKPLVLVGHSYGGWIAQVLAHRYDLNIKGLALIDSLHPDLWSRLPDTLTQKAAEAVVKMRKTAELAHHGKLTKQMILPPPVAVDEQRERAYYEAMLDPAMYRTIANEMAASQQLEDVLPPLQSTPVVVVSALDSFAAFPSLDESTRRASNQVWAELQREMASRDSLVAHLTSTTGDHRLYRTDLHTTVRGVSMLLAAVQDANWAQNEQHSVRALLEMWTGYKEAQTQNDVASIKANFAEDILLIPNHGPLLRGHAGGETFLGTLHQTYVPATRLQTLELIVRSPFAYRLGQYSIELRPKTGGENRFDEGSFLQVYRHDGTEWKIVVGMINSQRPPQDLLPTLGESASGSK